MSEMTPPVQIDKPENEVHVRYMKDVASSTDYDYPDVRERKQLSFLFQMQSSLSRQELFDHVDALWRDKGVQACYDRSNEYQLIDCAK